MITFRDQVESDAEWMAAMSASDDVIRYAEPERIGGDYVTVEELLDEWFPNIREYQKTGIHWAVLEHGEPVGWVFCRYDDPEGWEVGYRLRQSAWGRGIGTAAVRAAVDWACAQKLPLVYALVAAPNVASWRILEKLGFECVEVGEWHGMEDRRYERSCA